MPRCRLYPRFAKARVVEALRDTPVVLIHGPRQCGKTTLARMAGDPLGYAYFSFDDDVALAAGQTARLLNVTDLAGPFQLSRPTIRDYVTLLERVFLLEALAPWHSNRLSRLIKTPKLHVGDTGVACALLGLDAAALTRDRAMLGQLLETFVYQELRRQASWSESEVRFYHFRDKDGAEVDIVLERGPHEIAGVEVKAAATITAADFRGLRKLKDAAGQRFVAGVVLYDGEASAGFGDGLYAVPIRALWET